jgi:hypothetical protein
LNRSPEGAESNGPAVIDEAPETAVIENEAPETQDAEAPKVEKAKLTDWERYQKMQDKYARDAHAKPTKAELALAAKYQGKDESLIDGYTKSKGTQDEDESPAPTKAKAKEPEDAADVDPDSEIYKLVGAKDKTQLPDKLKGLVNEVKKLSGERGELGRILKDVGVNDLKALQAELRGARGLHQAVIDAKAGNPTALEFLGLNKAQAPQQRQQAQEFTGEIPDDVLDEGLYKHVISQAQQAKQEAEELRRELRAIKSKLDPWERSQAETQAQNQRTAQVNHVISEVTKLADGVEGLWDSKKSGPLAKALSEYYATDGDFHPDLKPIAEIIEIAKTHKLDDLEIALAYWERKNGGSLITKARDDARQPFLGKKPNIGLSDRQGNHNGTFKSYTEAHVREMAQGRAPIPTSWTDGNGTLIPDKVPAHLRASIFIQD